MKRGLDVVIEEELAEDVELLSKELVCEVHSRVQDTEPMLAQGG
jgi:hypothetical protein